ncbi:hypothetical protein C1T31_11330 [Hanstruepera neustonica]|uniref:DinB family protein n=1 Tax=Hanstruepera neustonica TaxID=1445657 RepID=A0A2K1DXH9_9FLAO|nr:hypothetical protein [Hanstruepera neustonica]PNQ72725.1 hypothetical protein C1T31_11330 [Hanstruepera neustonica]
MNPIIKANLKSLQKTTILLSHLSNDHLTNKSVSPYHSSVGSHIRHILDFYNCILNPSNNNFDLTKRCRNLEVETSCDSALSYLNTIKDGLQNLSCKDLEREVLVTDDLGLGKVDVIYTFSALLAQANSHTIHHYAIINYILDGINISLPDSDFGYNPTTPKSLNLN